MLLSGGVAHGAYQAGVLCGLHDQCKLPTYDVVTGVSTGSLVAALVFPGADYLPDLKRIYTSVKQGLIRGEVWKVKAFPPAGLGTDSLASSEPLRKLLKSIIDRLKNALTTQCLPQKLTKSTDPTEKDQVPCLVLAQLGELTDTCQGVGLELPSPEILAKFLEQKKAESGDVKDGGTDLSKFPVCVLKQLVVAAGGTCKDDPAKGWCYVENGNGQNPAGKCPQALIFSSATAALAGAQFSLQCIQQFSEDAGGK